jgi:type IV pilus assembly protein PilA
MKNIVKKGFSLIELLVVVAIIGILAGIAIVGYNSYVDSAKDSVNDANSSQLARKISIEKSKPIDFKVINTSGTITAQTYNTCTTTNAVTPSSLTDNTLLANAAACYAKAQGFANLKTTLLTNTTGSELANGELGVGTDAKVYYKKIDGTLGTIR